VSDLTETTIVKVPDVLVDLPQQSDRPRVSRGIGRAVRLPSRFPGTSSLAAVVVIWQVSVTLLDVPEFLLPSPVSVFNEFINRWDVLIGVHLRATAVAMLLAYAVSIIAGLALAALMTAWRPVERALYPVLVTLQSIPKIAVAPLVFIWMGFGLAPIVTITVLLTFFPIVISAVVGFKGTSPSMISLAKIVGLTPMQIFLKIRMPAAMPEIFGGLKVAATLAVLGVIVAEFVSSQEGLGHVVLVSMSAINTPRAFAAIILIVGLSLILFNALELIEKALMPWRRKQAE
jgi:NitT/TauT family transport system permease protein